MSNKGVKRSCDGKTKYKYHSAAKYAFDSHNTKLDIHIYKCEFCNDYHIGRKPKIKKQYDEK